MFVTVGLFSGCSLFGVGSDDTTKLEGILTEQSVTDSYAGTHLLTDADGVITPLTSISVKLSDVQFLNNKVEITGKMGDDGLFDVKSINLIAVVEQTNKPGEFVLYQNGVLGFKIKYYSDWSLQENSDSITLQAPTKNGAVNSDQISIARTIYNYIPTTPVTPVLKVNSDNFTDQVKPDVTPTTAPTVAPVVADTPLSIYFSKIGKVDGAMKKIGPDNIDAAMMDDGFNRIDYYVYRPGYIYKISFIPSPSSYDLENKNIFNKILAEFQFVDFSTEIKNDGSKLAPGKKEVFLPNMDVETKATTKTPAVTTPITPEVKQPTPVDTNPKTSTLPSSVPALKDIKLATFTSTGFKFSVDYPKNWYFEGTKVESESDSFLFPFSDKKEMTPVLVGLYISKTGMPKSDPSCKTFTLASGNESYVCSSSIYVKAGNKVLRLETTDPKYTDIMLNMAASVKSME